MSRWDKAKLTHNLNPGDHVRIKGFKTTTKVIELTPMPHWENCVKLESPLQGWRLWDAHELEKVSEPAKQRRRHTDIRQQPKQVGAVSQDGPTAKAGR